MYFLAAARTEAYFEQVSAFYELNLNISFIFLYRFPCLYQFSVAGRTTILKRMRYEIIVLVGWMAMQSLYIKIQNYTLL